MAGTTKYEIYLMNVPFNNTYNDVVYFNNKTTQITAFQDIATYHYTNLNIIVKNKTFNLAGRWDKFNECNYMMWRYTDNYGTDNDHTSNWFFSFIDEVKYNTRLGTLIKHTLDVWQTYHIDANLSRKTFVERGMVKPTTDDVFGRWLSPEPISSPASVETSSNIFTGLDFTPELVADTLSLPNEFQGDIYENDIYFNGRLCEYQYGGLGSGYNDEKLTGTYRFGVYDVNKFFSIFNLPEKFVGNNPNSSRQLAIPAYQQNSHLTDIIKMTFIPAFLYNNSTRQVFYALDNNGNAEAIADCFSENQLIEEDEYVVINRDSGSLACGYTPHNKKMYTSLCNAYKIYNMNGLSIPLKVELIKQQTWTDEHQVSHTGYRIGIKLSMNNYSNIMKLSLLEYNSTNRFFDIAYSYDIAFGYNSNSGVAHASKEMQLANQDYVRKYQGYMPYFNAGTELFSGGLAVGTAGMMGSYETTPNVYTGAEGEISGSTLRTGGAGLGLITKGLSDLAKADYNLRELNFNYSQAVADTYASIGMSIGNSSSSRTNMKAKFWRLRLAKCSPLNDECRQIEDFLDRYGYSINELLPLNYFILSRKYWNFIKTKNSQIKTKSPNNDNIIFNDIFNSGVTVWHYNLTDKFSIVGNYGKNNYQDGSNAYSII